MFNRFKLSVFMVSTFVSVTLLILVCSLYVGEHWFMIPIVGVLLGYFVVFYPILFKRQSFIFVCRL